MEQELSTNPYGLYKESTCYKINVLLNLVTIWLCILLITTLLIKALIYTKMFSLIEFHITIILRVLRFVIFSSAYDFLLAGLCK